MAKMPKRKSKKESLMAKMPKRKSKKESLCGKIKDFIQKNEQSLLFCLGMITVVIAVFLLWPQCPTEKEDTACPELIVNITKDCTIKNSSDYKTSKPLGVAKKGEKYEITGVFGDWVNVIAQETETNGISGWVWEKQILFKTNGKGLGLFYREGTIKKPGAALKELPKKDSKNIILLKTGERVGVSFPDVTWVEIEKGKWVYVEYTDFHNVVDLTE